MAVSVNTDKCFMIEIADRKTRVDAILENRDQQGNPQPLSLITSHEHAKQHPNTEKVLEYDLDWKFSSLEELAAKFYIPLQPLKKQVEEYKSYVRDGEDKQFGKSMEKPRTSLSRYPSRWCGCVPSRFPADFVCLDCHDLESLVESPARPEKKKWQDPHNNLHLHYGKDVPCMECHGGHQVREPLYNECHKIAYQEHKS